MKNTLSGLNFHRPDHYLRYPIVLKSAKGTNIKDINGKEYLDLFAVMGTVNCGHNHPGINEVLIKQIKTLWAANFFPTDIQLEAISKINAILPEDFEVAVLYSTGTEAIEQAIRLARAATGRNRIISFKDHYHGKTHGTLFLMRSYPDCYGPGPDSYRTVIENDGKGDSDLIEEYLNEAMGNDVAAVILEPVIGYSGPRRLNKEFLITVRRFCDKNNIIMIVDEILTGFQRCKGWFVSCQEGINPDIIVFGKGLGNGYPISGVACIESLFKYMKQTIPGSTFAGNSLGCSVACGVVDFMCQQNFAEKTSRLEKYFFEFFLQPRYQSYGIKPDGMGGLLSISFKDQSFIRMQDIYIHILRKGVITSHTNTSLRITPPLIITMNDFEKGLEVIGKCIHRFMEKY